MNLINKNTGKFNPAPTPDFDDEDRAGGMVLVALVVLGFMVTISVIGCYMASKSAPAIEAEVQEWRAKN